MQTKTDESFGANWSIECRQFHCSDIHDDKRGIREDSINDGCNGSDLMRTRCTRSIILRQVIARHLEENTGKNCTMNILH